MDAINNCDVLLMNIPISRDIRTKKNMAHRLSMPHLGLLYIAANLIENNYSVQFIDYAVEFMDKDTFVATLKRMNPRVIGISTYVESWSVMKALSQLIKQILPDVMIVAGGACATFCAEKVLRQMAFDYVILGEGEYIFKKLCDYLLHNIGEISEIEGMVYLQDDKVKVTQKNNRIKDLDALHFPARNLIDLEKYVYPITISTARGCPGNCTFCASKSFWGNKVYLRSPENIIKEIQEIEQNYHLNEFFVVDDTFTLIPARALKFCELLNKLDKRFVWGCESRADVISEELLEAMYKAGCRKIQFGMESANNEILRLIKKQVTFEQIERAVSLASKIGFDINVSVIIGHAADTHDTIQHTLDMSIGLKEKYGVNVLFSINTPFPGTDIYNQAEKYDIQILTDNFDLYSVDNAIINTKYLKSTDLRYYYQKALSLIGIK